MILRRVVGVRAWRPAIPAIVVMAVVVGVPMVWALRTSLLQQSTGVPGQLRFVALTNYGTLAADPHWWAGLGLTLLLTATIVATQLALGLVFAAALRQVSSMWRFARSVVLVGALTMAVTSAVGAEYAVRTGFLHTWLGWGKVGDFETLLAVYGAEVWRGTGWVTLICAAAMFRLSDEFVVLATVDGPGLIRRILRIWWPALRPALVFAAVFRIADTIRMVEGPVVRDGASRPLSAMLWNEAFVTGQRGQAAASAVVLLVVIAIVGIGSARIARKALE